MRTTTRAVLGFLSMAAVGIAGGAGPAASAPAQTSPVVVAAPDDLSRVLPGETTTVSVLDNDTVDSQPATPTNASVTPDAPPAPGLALGPDGTVTVSATAQPGRFTYGYTVCSTADPDACDASTAAVSVGAVVTIDPAIQVSAAPGGTTGSVLAGVTLNGLPATVDTVSIRPEESPAVGLRMALDGTITVEASTPPGTYTYPFLACAEAEPFACPAGAAAVTVAGTGGPTGGEVLPLTGRDAGTPAALAVTLLGAGAAMLVARDRRMARLQPAPRHRRQ